MKNGDCSDKTFFYKAFIVSTLQFAFFTDAVRAFLGIPPQNHQSFGMAIYVSSRLFLTIGIVGGHQSTFGSAAAPNSKTNHYLSLKLLFTWLISDECSNFTIRYCAIIGWKNPHPHVNFHHSWTNSSPGLLSEMCIPGFMFQICAFTLPKWNKTKKEKLYWNWGLNVW